MGKEARINLPLELDRINGGFEIYCDRGYIAVRISHEIEFMVFEDFIGEAFDRVEHVVMPMLEGNGHAI